MKHWAVSIRLRILYTVLISISLVFCCGGCATTDPASSRSGLPNTKVVLNPGDTIDIKFFYASELNDTQIIRPDGLISLQLVGDIRVWGMTPKELRAVLISHYSKLVEKPEVAVIVRKLANRGIYVGGAVMRPGRIEIPGHITALEAIMQSGGFNRVSANVTDVVVLRRDGQQYKTYHLDFKDALKGKKKELFYLHSSDIVYVPRTAVNNVNQWIDQHINNMIPQFGIRYTKVSGDSSYSIDTTNYR